MSDINILLAILEREHALVAEIENHADWPANAHVIDVVAQASSLTRELEEARGIAGALGSYAMSGGLENTPEYMTGLWRCILAMGDAFGSRVMVPPWAEDWAAKARQSLIDRPAVIARFERIPLGDDISRAVSGLELRGDHLEQGVAQPAAKAEE